ncbi:MAG: hypothetical protein WC428_06300 [Candidatus Paceibacterota bacterium]|jgi:DNA-binding Xre family transcriptional regulator/DNA-directed RNA polymerase subunit RPC12/RpoP
MPAKLKLTEKLFNKGLNDREIAEKLGISVNQVFMLRTKKLRLTRITDLRVCEKCKEIKSTHCFSKKSLGHEDWCITCRREIGLDLYTRNSITNCGSPANHGKFVCMRCNKSFESPIWGDNLTQHYHLCKPCRWAVSSIDRIGI